MSRTDDNTTAQAAAAEKADGEQTMRLHGPRPPVTRINPRVVALALVLVATVGGLALIVGVGGNRRSARDRGERETNLVRPSDQVVQTSIVGGLPPDYTYDVRKDFEDVGYEDNAKPRPATQPGLTRPSAEELASERERRRLLEGLRAEAEKAMGSPLVFASARRHGQARRTERGTSAPTGRPRGGSSEGPAATSPGAGGVTATLSAPTADANVAQPPETRRNLQNEKERFVTEAGAVEPYLKKALLRPLSKHELKAGTLIPGALLTAINTDLPGEVVAQVTENVYDTVTGDHLLVPQGSRLLGKYQSLVSNGQNRALVLWSRLILPNGNSIVLDGMRGTDQLGQAGLRDRVDFHLDRVGGAVALSTAIAYGGNLARGSGGRGRGGYDARDVIGDTVAQEASRVGQRFVDRELDVQPTITIRSGWPLRVLVNKDMLLAPYEAE